MAEKSPQGSKDKKVGKTLLEKRSAKKAKKAEKGKRNSA
jgi:hypothetical protein